MASAIDATKPVAGSPTTQSVRDNFATAAAEITALQTAPNQTITLSGDITGSGTAAIPTTLPTVNSNVGTFQGLTVNAKGQVTAAANQAYAPLASPALTGSPTVNGAAFAAGHLPGTATNDSAAAGQVGEVITAISGAVALAAGTVTNICTLTLTAGDWDVSGELWGLGSANGYLHGAINTVSATLPTGPNGSSSYSSITDAGLGDTIMAISPCVILINAPISVYLIAQSGVALTGVGKLFARRAR
jgi:hypothetical protein